MTALLTVTETMLNVQMYLPRGPPWPLKFPPPRWLPPLFGLKAKLILSLKGKGKIDLLNHSQ